MESISKIQDSETDIAQSQHAEGLGFVERHRDIFEQYARGRVGFEPAPDGLGTFAFDLKTNTIYINSRFYREKGLSDQKTAFAVLHEIEHLLEKAEMLVEPQGDRKFANYIKKLKESKAYSVLDNCVADIRENRAVVTSTNQSFADLERSLYTEDLFRQTNFTEQPRHIQFAQAILREARVGGEECAVSPDVRAKLDELKEIVSGDGIPLLEIITNPDIPMSVRVSLQDKYIWPMCKELLDKDIEDRKKKKKEQQKQQNNNNNSGDEGENGDKSDGEDPDDNLQPNESKDDGDEVGEDGFDPNTIFADEYQEVISKVGGAVPTEEIEKAFKEYIEAAKENSVEKADQEYADRIGVRKKDLQKYREIVKSFEKIINPETGESLVEELQQIFKRIIAKRLKPQSAPRYPVEEGEDLVHPADLVASVKAGSFEPKVWETYELKEKIGSKFGEVEITIVCDRSDSMAQGGGRKATEQMRSAVLVMESLKDFNDVLDEERVNMDTPLEIRSEVYSFQATSDDSVPIKKMSKDISEKDRVGVLGILSSTPGNDTTDYVTLEAIDRNIDEDTVKKIESGELKKIVIVFTDGESGDVGSVRNKLDLLRKKGIVVVGVGITKDGTSALKTYSPDAKLAEKTEDLPVVVSDLLKEHLQDL